jgi:hypothetical protein
MARFLHVKARCIEYPGGGGVKRFPVPDDKVEWSVPFPEYAPVDYTAPSVLAQPVWADFDIRKPEFKGPFPKFNALDGKGLFNVLRFFFVVVLLLCVIVLLCCEFHCHKQRE